MCCDVGPRSSRAPGLVAVAVAAALAISGCGKKGDPHPPLRIVPVVTEDLVVSRTGESLIVRFTHPKTTIAGQTLPDLVAVEIWGLQLAGGVEPTVTVDPRQFAAGAREVVRLEGEELTSAVAGGEIVARVRAPRTGEASEVFGVRTVPRAGEASDFSNLVILGPVAVPSPPSDLELEPREEGIHVGWEPVEQEVVGYHVYRRPASSRAYGEPVAFLGPARRRFLDESASMGESYIYTVTSVAQREPSIESGFGGEVEIQYVDRFPPPPPTGLVALGQQGAVRLVWKPSPAADVAGYVVSRRDPGSQEFRRLDEAPVTDLKYLDRGLSEGLLYAYRVAAVDEAGNEGEASPPAEARAR